MPTDKDLNHIFLLETRTWKPYQLKVHVITERSNIRLFSGDNDAIDKKWWELLDRKPGTHIGPTIRLVGWYKNNSNLILHVISSDYKESSLFGYLGVAMVLLTSDNHVVLQDRSKYSVYGDNLRIPGCTPTNTEVLSEVVRETYEEFKIKVKKDDLKVVGLTYTRPPATIVPHHCLIVTVTCGVSKAQVEQNWNNVKDKKEGPPVLVPFDKDKRKMLPFKHSNQEIVYGNCLILLLVLDSLSKESSFIDYKWFDNLWRLGSLRPSNYSHAKSD